jgi:hypothetical protein
MLKLSDKEMAYSIALFRQGCASLRCSVDGHSHRRGLPQVATLEEARPSVEELKKAIDGLFFINEDMAPEEIIERGQKRKRLYDSMLRPYETNPAHLDELMKKVIREMVFGWGQETQYRNSRNMDVFNPN